MISHSAQKWLLARSRNAIEYFFETQKQDDRLPEIPMAISSEVATIAGVFVFLKHKRLKGEYKIRGMMGEIYSAGPLWQIIPQYAVSAAFFDMHVPRLKSYELNEIALQVGIVADVVAHEDKSPEEFLDYLEINRPGVIIEFHERQASFLPSVWERIPGPKQFLRMLEFQLGVYRLKNKKGMVYKTFELEEFGES